MLSDDADRYIALRRALGFKLRKAARNFAAAPRLTRARAILTNEAMDLSIDVERKTYWSPAVAETDLPQNVAIELKFADTQRQNGVTGGFRFYPNGGSSGGDVAIRPTGRVAHIAVNWLTGRAELQQ